MNKKTKNTLALIAPALVVIVFAFLLGGGREKTEPAETKETTMSLTKPQEENQATMPEMQLEEGKDYKAILNTSLGSIEIDLYENKVPITVNNFVYLSKSDFYNSTRFHRIIKGFMIQGGDPLGNGTGGPGYKFDDEPIQDEYTRGTIAMANSGPNTNGSQFFIMHQDYNLPKNYVIFGRATKEESLKVIDAIANIPVRESSTGEISDPTENVVIESIEIIAE